MAPPKPGTSSFEIPYALLFLKVQLSTVVLKAPFVPKINHHFS